MAQCFQRLLCFFQNLWRQGIVIVLGGIAHSYASLSILMQQSLTEQLAVVKSLEVVSSDDAAGEAQNVVVVEFVLDGVKVLTPEFVGRQLDIKLVAESEFGAIVDVVVDCAVLTTSV